MNKFEELREQCAKIANQFVGTDQIVDAIRALPLPKVNQEPVLYQCRIAPNWLRPRQWTEWEKCTKEQYDDYIKVKELHDWLYHARALYLLPPDAEELRKENEQLKALLQKHGLSIEDHDV